MARQANNLSLNDSKTKELIVDYRRRRGKHTSIHIDGAVVQRVESFKFLCIHIPKELTWSTHNHTSAKRARPFAPQEAEKIWHGPSDPQKVLKLHH
jgi:hypothetical protein